jgi:peptidyl-prolyl cis-trans isomerase B (cyclophilin B)
MKKISILICVFILLVINAEAQTKFEIVTSVGTMRGILYDNTPMHKENFIELVKKKKYNGVLFHRVIDKFMIQTGDLDSKDAKKGQSLGHGDIGYTIPAEFNPEYIHKKGALAAARQGDKVNPAKESSGSQFYIVQGQTFTDEQLNMFEQRGKRIKFSEEHRNLYKTLGGTPHLDYGYTVFGEITEGIEIIDKIAAVQTDQRNRPLEDVAVESIKIIKRR